jgi:hypothetical protein
MSLSVWMRLKRQFTVVCGICNTIATTMKSGNSWKMRSGPYRFCVVVLRRCTLTKDDDEQRQPPGFRGQLLQSEQF